MAWTSYASLLLVYSLTLVSCYTESITGLNFIGSHFGVPGFNESYDYVVVGGGTGGLATATRLAQQGHQVAVVEAGSFYEMDNGNLSSIPGDSAYFVGANPALRNPIIDWGQETTPQPVGLPPWHPFAAEKPF
jgi:choline dehydrogenase